MAGILKSHFNSLYEWIYYNNLFLLFIFTIQLLLWLCYFLTSILLKIKIIFYSFVSIWWSSDCIQNPIFYKDIRISYDGFAKRCSTSWEIKNLIQMESLMFVNNCKERGISNRSLSRNSIIASRMVSGKFSIAGQHFWSQ